MLQGLFLVERASIELHFMPTPLLKSGFKRVRAFFREPVALQKRLNQENSSNASTFEAWSNFGKHEFPRGLGSLGKHFC